MNTVNKSAGEYAAISSAAAAGNDALCASLSVVAHDDGATLHVIDLYLSQYAGRDPSRLQLIGWWDRRLGNLRLTEFDDVHV